MVPLSTKLSISARMAALPRAAAGPSLFLADSAPAAGATTYVASPTGSGPNNGTAPDIPIQSLGRASGPQLAHHGGKALHQHRGRHQHARLD